MIEKYENSSAPTFVTKAAFELHKQKSEALHTRLSDTFQTDCENKGLGWRLENNTLCFESLGLRNQYVAHAVFNDIAAESTPKQIFERAYDLWRNEIGSPDFASGRLLALMHQTTDVLARSAELIHHKEFAVFEVMHLIVAALPHLKKIYPDSLISLTAMQYEHTKAGFAREILFNALELRFKNDNTLAWEILRSIGEKRSEETLGLYASSLYVLMQSEDSIQANEIAFKEAESTEELQTRIAIWLLGRAIREGVFADQLQQRAMSLLIRRCDDPLMRVAQSAFGALCNAAITQSQLLDELVRRVNTGDQYILAKVADFLFMNFESFKTDPRSFELIAALVQLSPATIGGIDNFDWILHELFKESDTKELTLITLSKWIVAHGSKKLGDKVFVESFDQVTTAITNDKIALQTVITQWLLAPELQLAAACAELISWLWVHKFKEPVFSKPIIDELDANGLKFLARRILGYIISEEPLLSLTLSLLDTKDAKQRTFALVHTLLTQEVGRDYVAFTLDELNSRMSGADDTECALLKSAHTVLTDYTKKIEDLPRLLELRPPTQLRRMIALNRSREMRKSMDHASEKSVWRQIATEVQIKAGVGWFSVSSSGVGETHHLQSHSVQASLPRRALMDPIGYAIKGMYFRIAKRGEE